MSYRPFVFAAFLTLLSPAYGQNKESADVLVYGATPGGFCAAIAAAREGSSVVLLEPSGHVGGVNTGGLSFSDSNQTVRSTMMGLFDEWHTRVEADYKSRGIALPYVVSEKDHRHWTYEPHVAKRVTQQMLAEAHVKVVVNEPLKSLTKAGAKITGLSTEKGTYEAKVFIDGTYEGDLMAAAGVSWTIGREGRTDHDEPLAGRQYPKQKPAMKFSGLDAAGKQLPLITDTERGADEIGDKNVMVYSFRLCVTRNPANRVPFPVPDNYDPARFEVIRRYFRQENRPVLAWDLYPLPNEKFDANNGIYRQFSMGFVGACNGWSEADVTGRARMWEQHRQYTLELYHFLTTDESVPAPLREQLATVGLCKDEFPVTGHWSPQLYVREGRRMQGLYVLTQNDVMKHPGKEDPIGISSFPIDSHDCRRIGTGDSVVNEGTIFPVRMPGRPHGYPYQVPYRSLLPQPAQCTNLLVPVALSCTHVAFSSIRVEPTWMVLGQSAGVAAALSAKKEVNVQDLPYSILKERLMAQGQILDLPILPEFPKKRDPIDGK